MMTTIRCPWCRKDLEIEAKYVHMKRHQCKECKTKFLLSRGGKYTDVVHKGLEAKHERILKGLDNDD